MPVTRTLEFLPAVFQTETNRKFLNATLDQLIAEPKLTKVNGYIGRKFAPTAKSSDSYVSEPSALRSKYQLEPGVVVKDPETGVIHHHSSYPEVLQKLRYYGATNQDQNKSWESDYYSYNPHIDYDKFINFAQYYWLPNGPDSVDVFAGAIDLSKAYTVTTDPVTNAYNFTSLNGAPNPDIVLARGGSYDFVVNQPGRKFWIQSSPGTSGFQNVLSNLSSREVYGVTNNGDDVGTITFAVPQKTAQDFFVYMDSDGDVDYATTLSYSTLQGIMLSDLISEHNGIDGQITESMLTSKFLIFNGNQTADADWTAAGSATPIPQSQRMGVWRIYCQGIDTNGADTNVLSLVVDYRVELTFQFTVSVNHKVQVKTGAEFGGTEWYRTADFTFEQLPALTAILDVLYYQDSENPEINGVIRLVDSSSNYIDVENSILGKKYYTSPNGVTLTNGLKICFDSAVTPATYQNKEYYVEGVGTGITLTSLENLGDTYEDHDYIVINRSSLEKSQWSQGNRWFHSDVINLTAMYNGTTPVFDIESQARRPIIEFTPNLQLFDFGSHAKLPVDLYDTTHDRPFNTVEGVLLNSSTNSGFFIDGVEISAGMRIIFAADQDAETRNNVWVVSFNEVSESGLPQIHLTLADDGLADHGDTVLVKYGREYGNAKLWYNTDSWVLGQQKTALNQAPRFDVFDHSGISYGDRDYYPVSTEDQFFTGTEIFSYAIGTGANDTVLGFPLVYENVGNLGDISFENDFDNDTLEYTIDRNKYNIKVNTGRLKRNTADDNSVIWENTWVKVVTPSRQLQEFNFSYDGNPANNFFVVDILPREETIHPTLYVYLNGRRLSEYEYYIERGTNYEQQPINGFRVYVDYNLITAGDRVDIFVDSDSVSSIGTYELPEPLELNPLNTTAAKFTLSDIRTHVSSLTRSATTFSGKFPGSSNLRDIDIVAYRGSICQQSSNIPLAMMFMSDENLNVIDAINHATREYTRFKNRFLENATTSSDVAFMSVKDGVDAILKTINAAKNKSMPWFYSDMIPNGSNTNIIQYTVLNPAVKSYEITNITPMTSASNQSILVYCNGVQLIRGRDYDTSSESPAVIISDSFLLELDQDLTIVEYTSTEGCYVPETPTKLGLYPKFIPEIFVDATYNKPALLIRGHDGSTTPAFTTLPASGLLSDIDRFDFRDLLLLEVEKRIYNNIKVVYDDSHFTIHDVIPGKFRTNGYSLAEFNSVLAKFFLNWIGLNRLDYISNNTYKNDNVFTWNFRGQLDKLGSEELPGSWRACYDYYFDTQTPHLTPWEMLGFSEKPSWWEDTYGPAPYTGGNLVMWKDLENGYIANGPRQGVDSRYARPGLLSVIPVNEYGVLKSPEFLLKGTLADFNGAGSWVAGALGPVETAWKKSSEYPYALQAVMAILKPGKYFGVNVDRNLYTYDADIDQYVNRETDQRLVKNDIKIHGQTGKTSGYINWIVDNVRQRGVDPAEVFGVYISDYDIKLAYHMAGFSDKKYIKLLAEQYSPASSNNSVLIPDSDYDLVLTKSTPLGRITYSAVIVEKTTNGYRVSGYDSNAPVFTVIPPDPAGATSSINVLDKTVTIFKEFRKLRAVVPYGYEFANEQQVSNFLIGYGLNLAAQGFKFDEYDQNLEQIKNWVLSVREFLHWAQQGWKENSIIVLSPVGGNIATDVGLYTVDRVGNTLTGGRILNQNFQPIGAQSLTFSRVSNRFTCTTLNQDMIGLIDLNLVQYEHTIILNNTTMFNDVVYKPENGIRQYRLKLVGSKTMDWNGTVEAPGFIYYNGISDEWQPMRDYLKGDTVQYKSNTYSASRDLPGTAEFNFGDWVVFDADKQAKLLPNFTHNSIVSESFYDVDVVNLEDQFDLYGKGLIGYRNRNYLYSLGLDDISQVKFYQGFIKDKGSLNAFSALGRVSVGNNDSEVELSEEWAFRVGEYGALDTNQTVDLEINENNTLSDPFSVALTSTESDADIVIKTPYLSSAVDVPSALFINRDHTSSTPRITDIQTAGFPELNDVDYTLFDLNNFDSLKSELDNIGVGTKIWCAKDFESKWNVYRVVLTKVTATSVINALDNRVEISTNAPHGLEVGDIVILKNSKQFSGLYKIERTPSQRSFVIYYPGNLIGFTNISDLGGTIYSLKSMVFDYAFQVAEYQPLDGWRESDVAWIRYDSRGKWGTYKKITPWDFVRTLPRGRVADKQLYGTSVNLSVDNQVALVGNPSANDNKGEVIAYTRTYANKFRELATFTSTANDTVGMGQILEQGNFWSIVGAPSSKNLTGYVFVVHRTFGSVDVEQILVAPENQTSIQYGAKFGAAVSISQDDRWISVGAPGVGKMYVYGLKTDTPERSFSVTGDGTTTNFVLNFIPESIDSLTVKTDERLYIPFIDYTISGATLIFKSAPGAGIISVSQVPGYRLVDTVASGNGGSFGSSVAIATDGAQVLASAPYEDVVTKTVVAATNLVAGKRYQIAALGTSNFVSAGAASNAVGVQFTATTQITGTGSAFEVLVDAGAIYVYDRSVEAFVSDGSKIYTPRRPIKTVRRVTINEVEQTLDEDYSLVPAGLLTRVVFVNAPAVGATISIETNQVNLIERVVADDPQANSWLGYNINLCPTNCSLYSGMPMHSHSGKLNNGAVIRFFNTGRQSGYNIGEFLDPVTVSLYESASAGTNSFKVAGSRNMYPTLNAGLRVKTTNTGAPQFALVTSVVQTTGTYFTVTLDQALTDDVNFDTEITFERVPQVKVGDTMRINDFEVVFNSIGLNEAVNAINAASIPGVIAYNRGGYIELESNVLVTRRRLRVMAGKAGSTAIQDLGLRVYPQIQFITNPYDNDDKMFGKKVRITRALPDYGFLVGSDTASTYVTTTFDSNRTTFDQASLMIRDCQFGSGAVYMFTFMGDDRSTADFPAGKLAFAQQFVPSTPIPVGLRYGMDFDIQDNVVIIGAPEVDTYGSGVKGTAQVYEFVNPNNLLGWTLSSKEDFRVDIDSINKMFLWNKNSNVITSTLDYIDPAKGKILGIAEQEIKYKTAYDPAMYNRGNEANELNHWSNKQVGEVWWDLSKVRYIDYEHGDIPFRTSNWGLVFPGSSIEVYEWVESNYLPSEYVNNGGNGVPLYADDSAYVAISVVDTVSNREYNKYYYWVKDKTSVENNAFGRSLPISRVKELIENPRGQDVKFAAAVKSNTVALFNCSDEIKGNETILHIDYDTKLNSDIIHSEWELVKENVNTGFASIPEKIFNKLLDSLSGLDIHGNPVPDPLIPVQNRYGIGIRPRQSIFVNQQEAVRTLVKYLNQWFLTVPLALSFAIDDLSNAEPYPPVNSGIWDSMVPNFETLGYLDTYTLPTGYKVLVENDSNADGLWTIYTLQADLTWFLSRVQSYDDTPYWAYVDWYAEGYDLTTVPKFTVATMSDIDSLAYAVGDVIKVLNDGTGNFRLMVATASSVDTVGLQNGTVQFNESLYNLAEYGMGWNNGGFGVSRFDQNPSIELRKMLETLFSTVFSESYRPQYGKVLQSLFNYVLTEQKSTDWLFKTNFISVLHKLRKLTQPAVYSKDNQETYLEYLEEVKPYSATVREYVVNYDGVDNVNGYVTDFDVPADYDEILRLHRSPSGEYYQDRSTIDKSQYYEWRVNYPYSIETGTESVVLHRPGKGYTSKPVITITGSGTDDNALADVVSIVSGGISAINVHTAGANYTGFGIGGAPLATQVTITGGGLPSTFTEFSTGLAVTVDTVIKTSELQYFKVTVAGTLGILPVNKSNGDRWITQQVGDLVLSGTATLEFLGEEAVAHVKVSNGQIRKILPVLTFDRVSYRQNTVNLWEPNTDYQQGDVIYYRGQAYKAIVSFTSGSVFSPASLEQHYLTANERISAFYTPDTGSAGADPDLLQAGISYPGVLVTGPRFNDDPGFDNNLFDLDPFDNFELDADGTAILGSSLMDSLISSRFTDDFFTELVDTRPEGIVIDGGAYVDVYSSHAPEELIPGRIHEALDIQVSQTISPPLGGSLVSQSPNIQLTSYRVGDVPSRVYAYGNGEKFNDKLYVYSKTRGRLYVNEDYTIDFHNQELTLTAALGDNDLLFIYSSNQVGFEKQADLIYVGDGEQIKFSTGFSSAADINVFVQIDGNTVTDFVVVNNTVDNTKYIEFATAPADNSYIHVMIFNDNESIAVNQWSEMRTQTYIVDSAYGASTSDYVVTLDSPVYTDRPFTSEVVVELNGLRIRPTSSAYYVADGVGDKFALTTTDLDVVDSLTNNTLVTNDVSVFVNGDKQEFGVNYLLGDEALGVGDGSTKDFNTEIPASIVVTTVVTVDGVLQEAADITDPITYPNDYSIVSVGGFNYVRFTTAPADESEVRILVFRDNDKIGNYVFFNEFSTPPANSKVVVEVTKFADVFVANDGITVTIKNTLISANDRITVDTFSNHDILGIETRTFVGGQTYTTEIPIGFDQSAFDQGPKSFGHLNIPGAVSKIDDAPAISPEVPFDASDTATLVIAKFDLERSYTNLNYLWITLNGRRLIPVHDFIVEGNYLYISPQYTITEDSVLVVMNFANTPQIEVISFRQFKGITGNTEYLRIAMNATTEILEPVSQTDSVILVSDPTKLPIPGIEAAIPGVVFVNGERITYFRNYATEVITPWIPETDYPAQTLVSYQDPETDEVTVYDVVGSVNEANFTDALSNLVALSSNVVAHGLAQIRRGTNGTGATAHPAGSLVVDGSAQQTIPDTADRYAVAWFETADGETDAFATTVPDPEDLKIRTVLYITQDQYDDFGDKAQHLVSYYNAVKPDETAPYATANDFVNSMLTVHVGGAVIHPDLYTVILDETTYNGDTVYTISVTFATPPASGLIVAIELRDSRIWFDIGVVDQVIPVSSIEPGKSYQIETVGNTDFTEIGAASNVVGLQFIATSAGTGTGSVSYASTSAIAVSTTNQAKFLKEETGILL